ncbi:MAG TPA: DUF3830 family protein [Terriglobia bacterium]|nr:DUF3830 family protein [Terriglobia bacterium]
MPAPPRKIRLSFPTTGESAVAQLLDEEAPKVCQEIWEWLPIEYKAIHGQVSGSEVFVLLNDPKPLPEEQMVQMPLPGEILYFFDNGVSVTSGGQPSAEICVVYDRGTVLRGPEGVPTHAKLFARIPGDWKYDWIPFAQACRRVRWEGPQLLRIERVEE